MKLKIDEHQELLDRIRKLPDYQEFDNTLGYEKSLRDFCRKGEDGSYTYIDDRLDISFYRAQTIIDDIIPYYLKNIHNKTFATLDDLYPYDAFEVTFPKIG